MDAVQLAASRITADEKATSPHLRPQYLIVVGAGENQCLNGQVLLIDRSQNRCQSRIGFSRQNR